MLLQSRNRRLQLDDIVFRLNACSLVEERVIFFSYYLLIVANYCVSGQKSLFVFYSLSLNFVFFEYSDRGVDHLHFVNLNIIIQLLLFRFSLSISLEITFQIPIFYLSFLFSPNNHFAKKKIAYYFRIHRKYPFLH